MTKMSGLLTRGLSYTGCPKRLYNIWLAWSFQCNCMFKSTIINFIWKYDFLLNCV